MTVADVPTAEQLAPPGLEPAGVVRRQWQQRYVREVLVYDGLLALIAACVAYIGRFGAHGAPYSRPYLVLTFAVPVTWLAFLAVNRAYEPRFLFVGSEEYRRVLNAGVALTATAAIVSYAAKIDLARGYVVVVIPLTTFATLLARWLVRKRLHRARRRRGEFMRRVVVVGYERAVANLCRQLRRERYHGIEVVAACLPPHRPGREFIEDVGIPVLGTFLDVPAAAEAVGADTVAVLACPEMDGQALRRLAWSLERNRTDLLVAPALMDVAGPRTTIRPVDGLPLLHVEHPELSGARQLVKNIFDRLVAGLALLLLTPVLLGVALAIRLTSPGPALFRQVRVGRGGREFVLYKFRTMVVDAEDRLAELRARNDHDGVLFKIRKDPRVTSIGALLRRYSLDEFPQLINVLVGRMSLVGPRPPLPAEVAEYPDDARRRLVVKPGLTGLWQVSGRSDLSWDEAVRLDLRYVENWSLALDLVILWRTASAVLRASGAY